MTRPPHSIGARRNPSMRRVIGIATLQASRCRVMQAKPNDAVRSFLSDGRVLVQEGIRRSCRMFTLHGSGSGRPGVEALSTRRAAPGRRRALAAVAVVGGPGLATAQQAATLNGPRV